MQTSTALKTIQALLEEKGSEKWGLIGDILEELGRSDLGDYVKNELPKKEPYYTGPDDSYPSWANYSVGTRDKSNLRKDLYNALTKIEEEIDAEHDKFDETGHSWVAYNTHEIAWRVFREGVLTWLERHLTSNKG